MNLLVSRFTNGAEWFIEFIANIAVYIADHTSRAFNYVFYDERFFLLSAEVARDVFIVTSLILIIVMILAWPKNLLDISLTLREIFLSSILISAIIARQYEMSLPQWYIIAHYWLISSVGLLLIWALIREYFWSYWERRSEK